MTTTIRDQKRAEGHPLWAMFEDDDHEKFVQEYLAEKEARASLVLIRMGSDSRLPRNAIGYVDDLGHFKSGRDMELRWRFLHDRLTMLNRHIPDLCKEFADAIGFCCKLSHCVGCGKQTLHVGPRSEFCEICGATCGDFDS